MPPSLRLAAYTLALGLLAREARADDAGEPVEVEDTADHNEWAGFPVIGGSTDIGVQLGVAATITHQGDRFQPYWWKVDGLVSISVKGGPRGAEVVQQSHDMRFDIPGGGSGKIRLMPGVFYEKTINSSYFGPGNNSPLVSDRNGQVGERYQFRHEELSTRLNARSPLGGPFSTMYGWQLRYLRPRAYADSKLAIDAATRRDDGTPLIRGLEPLGIATVNQGFLYDTRDDEVFTRKGEYHLAALRLSGALPTDGHVYWAGLNIIVRKYVPLPGSFVLAGRIIVDLMAGNVPFYDLSQGGAFDPDDLPGGAESVRGIPNGRYSGLVKAIGNIELRRVHRAVRAFGSRFQIGTNEFFDTGRVWTNYTFDDPRDETGIGLKYGVGAGAFMIWDTAALFRIDVAYSPDASAANQAFRWASTFRTA